MSTVILNCRFIDFIAFHEFLHGFWSGSGTGFDSLDSVLLQKLTSMREEVLYEIFLALNKLYDALDRYR